MIINPDYASAAMLSYIFGGSVIEAGGYYNGNNSGSDTPRGKPRGFCQIILTFFFLLH
jgi:hypothetical protein